MGIMKRNNILNAACIIVTVSAAAATEHPASPNDVSTYGGYELVWADEFNKHGTPDPNRWTYERGFVRNEELQWYQPENARCEDGLRAHGPGAGEPAG